MHIVVIGGQLNRHHYLPSKLSIVGTTLCAEREGIPLLKIVNLEPLTSVLANGERVEKADFQGTLDDGCPNTAKFTATLSPHQDISGQESIFHIQSPTDTSFGARVRILN